MAKKSTGVTVETTKMNQSYYDNEAVPKRFQASDIMDEADQKIMNQFWIEWIAMHNARGPHEGEWKRKERQFRAKIGLEAQNEMKSQMKAQLLEQVNSTSADIKLPERNNHDEYVYFYE